VNNYGEISGADQRRPEAGALVIDDCGNVLIAGGNGGEGGRCAYFGGRTGRGIRLAST